MLDDARLRRLAEMGIDVYLPRSAPAASRAPDTAGDARSATGATTTPNADAAPSQSRPVLLLARTASPAEQRLLAQIVRALAFARVACDASERVDADAIGRAAGLVVFGDAMAREVGAVSSVAGTRAQGWVAARPLAEIARDARAKRALWSELRRMTRELGVARPG